MSIVIEHGAAVLPSVTVDGYNAELRDGDGFTGDRASNRAFRSLLDDVRERLAATGGDPLGEGATAHLDPSALDDMLAAGEPAQAAVIQTAMKRSRASSPLSFGAS